ncbi:MAG: hypothetical protein J5768_00225 [Spirochaetales bacterium]|nr:hypothetical protein [Spirochaetales bacterium]MBO4423915.1 hypothetical protein [Spirochaetales bacterium]
MKRKTWELRATRPVCTPRIGVRIGTAIKVGNQYLLEVKHGKNSDYITTVELIEQIEGRKVCKIIFLEAVENAG